MAATTLRPLIAGNWKMNGLSASAAELDAMIAGAPGVAKVDLLICPPATLVGAFAARARAGRVAIGAQDCHARASGAHTGDLSAEMFKDAGASHIIVGHSPRQGGSGVAGGPRGHRLRRRNAGGTRCRQNAGCHRHATRRIAAGRRNRRQSRGGL